MYQSLAILSIYILTQVCYNIVVRQGETPLKGEEKMDEMTNHEFDEFLEMLAQLIESKAKTVEEAAEIIRERKSK